MCKDLARDFFSHKCLVRDGSEQAYLFVAGQSGEKDSLYKEL